MMSSDTNKNQGETDTSSHETGAAPGYSTESVADKTVNPFDAMSQDDFQKLESVLSSEAALQLLEETTQQFVGDEQMQLHQGALGDVLTAGHGHQGALGDAATAGHGRQGAIGDATTTAGHGHQGAVGDATTTTTTDGPLNSSLDDNIKDLIEDGLGGYAAAAAGRERAVLRSPTEALEYLTAPTDGATEKRRGSAILMDHCYTSQRTSPAATPPPQPPEGDSGNAHGDGPSSDVAADSPAAVAGDDDGGGAQQQKAAARRQTGSPMRRSRRQQEKQEQIMLEEIKRENAEVERKWLAEQQQHQQGAPPRAGDVAAPSPGVGRGRGRPAAAGEGKTPPPAGPGRGRGRRAAGQKAGEDAAAAAVETPEPSRMVTRGKRVPVGKMLGLREKVEKSDAAAGKTSPEKQKKPGPRGAAKAEEAREEAAAAKSAEKGGKVAKEAAVVAAATPGKEPVKTPKARMGRPPRTTPKQEVGEKTPARTPGRPQKRTAKEAEDAEAEEAERQHPPEPAEARHVVAATPEKRRKHSSSRDEKPYEIKKTASLVVPELFTPDAFVKAPKEPHHVDDKSMKSVVAKDSSGKSEAGEDAASTEDKADVAAVSAKAEEAAVVVAAASDNVEEKPVIAASVKAETKMKDEVAGGPAESRQVAPRDAEAKSGGDGEAATNRARKPSDDADRHRHHHRSLSLDAPHHRHGNKDEQQQQQRHSMSSDARAKKPSSSVTRDGKKSAKLVVTQKKPSDAERKPGDAERKPGEAARKPGDSERKPGDAERKPPRDKPPRKATGARVAVRESKRERKPKKLGANEVSDVSTESESESDSGSEGGGGGEEEDAWTSDDDPEKLWCVCKQPHDDRFMICCDTCEEWYHGNCVNITKKQGKEMEKNGIEYICPDCVKQRQSGGDSKGKVKLGEQEAKSKKLSASKDVDPAPKRKRMIKIFKKSHRKLGQACIMSGCRHAARPGTLYCSNECILKHAKESLNMLHHNKPPPPPSASSLAATAAAKDVKDIKESKNVQQVAPVRSALEEEKVLVVERSTGRVLSGPCAPTASTLESWLSAHPTFEVVKPGPIASSKFYGKQGKLPEKGAGERKPSSGKASGKADAKPKEEPAKAEGKKEPAGPHPVRMNVRRSLKEHLTERLKQASDISVTSNEVKRIVMAIEQGMYNLFHDTGVKYKAKYRSLLFNIKDRKNHVLYKKILKGKVTPYSLVHMTPEDLASKELAQWRKHEMSHELEMIKKNEEEQSHMAKHVLKKTHKGEVSVADEDLSTLESGVKSVHAALEDPIDEAYGKKTRGGGGDARGGRDAIGNLLVDTTSQHRAHLFDLNCKVCTGKVVLPKKEEESVEVKVAKKIIPEHKNNRSSHKDSKSSSGGGGGSSGGSGKDEKSNRRSYSHHHSKDGKDKKHQYHRSSQRGPTEKTAADEDKSSSSSSTLKKSSSSFGVSPSTPDLPESNVTTTTESPRPSSTTVLSSPESFLPSQSGQPVTPVRKQPLIQSVWKGLLQMQDMPKFVVMAYRVSGVMDGLSEELPDTLTVCGRISPSQVWDYISRVKEVGNKMISLIRLQAATEEDKQVLVQLYSYLYQKQRCGVIGLLPAVFKDFYLIPLSSHDPIPNALLPFQGGPGLEPNRSHMILGLIVRHRVATKRSGEPSSPERGGAATKKARVEHGGKGRHRGGASQQHGGKRDDDGGSGGGGSKREDTDTSGSQTPTTRDPSPPSSSSSSAKRAEDGDDSHDPIVKRYAGMDSLGLAGDARLPGDSPYTPPGGDDDDDEPYDPAAEPYDAGTAVAGGNGGEVDDAERSRSSTNDLMKKLAQMKNPVEMTSSILSSLSDSSATLEEQKELLRELSHKVEEQKRHIEMRQLSECAASAATATAASAAPPDEQPPLPPEAAPEVPPPPAAPPADDAIPGFGGGGGGGGSAIPGLGTAASVLSDTVSMIASMTGLPTGGATAAPPFFATTGPPPAMSTPPAMSAAWSGGGGPGAWSAASTWSGPPPIMAPSWSGPAATAAPTWRGMPPGRPGVRWPPPRYRGEPPPPGTEDDAPPVSAAQGGRMREEEEEDEEEAVRAQSSVQLGAVGQLLERIRASQAIKDQQQQQQHQQQQQQQQQQQHHQQQQPPFQGGTDMDWRSGDTDWRH